MRPKIHGWIVSLLLVGAGGLALGAFAFRDGGQVASKGGHNPLDPAELSALITAQVRALNPAGAEKQPSVSETTPASNPPRLFDVERSSALAKAREDRQRESQAAANDSPVPTQKPITLLVPPSVSETTRASNPPQPFDVERSSAVAKSREDRRRESHAIANDSPAPTQKPITRVAPPLDARLGSVIQAAYEAPEPAEPPQQDSSLNRVPQRKAPVRSASNTPVAQSPQEVRREQVQVPETVWAVLRSRGGLQDVRLVQQPEPGQVTANIGQVEVQAIDQLGVVILKGSPQDVEAMKKIIEEIQKISEGVEPYIRVFQINRAPATQIRDKLQELYSGATSSTSSSAARTTTGQPTTTTGQAAPSATGVVQTPALRRFQVAADDRSNTLIVLASPQMMEELARVIERLDADTAAVVNDIRVFPLKNAEAQEVANILTQAISGQAAGTAGETIGGTAATVSGGGEVRVAKRTAQLRFVPSEGRTIESGILDEVRVTAVIRTNSVIVSAPSSSMPLMASIINELDKPPQIVASMKVFELKYADATNMRITLQELFDLEPTTGTGLGGGGGGAFGTTGNQQFQRPMAVAAGDSPPVSIRVAVDERTNSLIVSGPENAVLQIQAVINTLDLSDIYNRKSTVYRLKNSYAIDVATTLTQFFTNKRNIEGQTAAPLNAASGTIVGPYARMEQDVVVVALDNSLAATLTTAANVTSTAIPNTQGVSNLLLISASPRSYPQVMKMIEELDGPQPQVMIQCIIAQLTVTDDFEFGIEFGLQNDVLFNRGNIPFTSTSSALNTPSATTAANANAGTLPGNPGFPFNTLGPLGNHVPAAPAQVGNQGLSNFALGRSSLIDGLTNVGGLVLTASSQNVSAMLRAMQNDGRVEVLSRPQIMTLDGRTARVLVGENFPYVGSVTGGETATVSQVQFASIGIILTVKPNITPDNRIYLEIVPEVSELRELVVVQQLATTTGVFNQTAPRITQTTANTVVAVNDGQTVVLGGLIQKRHTDFVRKIPWLGDLPCIGCLFRFTQEREMRQELLVIMTPHIVRNEADAQRIKDIEVARSNWILCHTPEMHGDLGLGQSETTDGSAPDPTLSNPDTQIIRPTGAEEPVSGPPSDWAIPPQPADDLSKNDPKQRTMGEKVRRVFRRP